MKEEKVKARLKEWLAVYEKAIKEVEQADPKHYTFMYKQLRINYLQGCIEGVHKALDVMQFTGGDN